MTTRDKILLALWKALTFGITLAALGWGIYVRYFHR